MPMISPFSSSLSFGAQKLEKPLWVYVKNTGDGGAYAVAFKNRQDAENVAEQNDERFCDDVHSITTVYDSAEEYFDRFA